MAEQNSAQANGGDPATQVLSDLNALKSQLQTAEKQRDEYLDLVKQTRSYEALHKMIETYKDIDDRAARGIAGNG